MDVITMIGNTGTYLDSPFHRYADGTDLAGLDLATLVDLPAEVFHLTDAGRRARGIPAPATLAGPRPARHGRAAAHRLGPPLRHPGIRRTAPVPHAPTARST